MNFHRAIERVRDMPFGEVAWEQLLLILSTTTDLHSKDAKHHYEATHLEGASDEHAVQILDQHRRGVGEASWAPEPALNDRSQKSWAQYIRSGNQRIAEHQLVEGNAYGATRSATATGASVEADPSYVPVTDDETSAAFNVFMPIYQPFASGDRVMYVLKKDGTAWTFGGGNGSGLRKATATGNWSGNSVAATDDETGAVLSISLPNTMPGDPNVRIGAPIYYMRANDGNLVCLTDYMDDKIGVLKVFDQDGAAPIAGWAHHAASAARLIPNYDPGDSDYPTTGTTGGTRVHTHDSHVLSMTGVEVVSAASFDDETCALSTTTIQLCFLGSTV